MGLGYSTADTNTAAVAGRKAADAVIASWANDGANQAGGYADTSGYRPSTRRVRRLWEGG